MPEPVVVRVDPRAERAPGQGAWARVGEARPAETGEVERAAVARESGIELPHRRRGGLDAGRRRPAAVGRAGGEDVAVGGAAVARGGEDERAPVRGDVRVDLF